MKRLLLLSGVMITAILFTACNTNPVTSAEMLTADTSGFAEFQAMKKAEFEAWKAINTAPASQAITKATTVPVTEKVVMTSSSTHEAKTATKKGWSKAAKYSVIGGVGGVTLGAVINKKDRVKGGIVGGVVLGGLGYLLGRSQDKKEGRY